MSDKKDAKESPFKEQKKEDAPLLCPFMAMAYGHLTTEFEDMARNEEKNEGSDFNCRFERCWFYNRHKKKCVFVMMAISQAVIAEQSAIRSGLIQPQSLKDLHARSEMESLKRQHRPLEE